MTNKITKKTKSSTLTKLTFVRFLWTFALAFLMKEALSITPVAAAKTVSTLKKATATTGAAVDVSNTSTVTVDGVKYTTLLKQGQVQLTVDNKVLLLSKENVMAACGLDKNGITWCISYSGRCSGYSYALQSNEPTPNLHTYLSNAEGLIFNNKLVVGIKTTTGNIDLPGVEEFKKLASYSSTTDNGNTGNGNNNNGSTNNGSTNNGSTNNGNNSNGSTSTYSNVVTKTVSGKQITVVVTNGEGQVFVGETPTKLPDKGITEVGIDSNGTVIYMLSDKTVRWFNPSLQMKESKILVKDATCLLKDEKDFVTGAVANSVIVKVLTITEQKKALGIENTTKKVDESRVIKSGDYTYSVYKPDGKQLTKYTFKKGVVNWRGVKYSKIKRVGVIKKSHNMIQTTSKGSVVIINYDTMVKKTIFKAGKVKAKSYTYDSKGFVTGYITTDGIRHSVTSK